MEALLPKRPCCTSEAARTPSSPTAAMAPGASGNPESTDQLLEALLGDPGFSSAKVELSVERFVESRVCDSGKDRAIDSAVRIGEALLAAAKRCARRLATRHNSASWPLPPDVTVKVFSLLDTQSVCHAAATCSMFNRCANDPLCYANVDLTSVVPKVNNAIVCTMVQRAGKNLRHIELRQTLESVYTHCHLIERLFLESSRNGRDDSLKSATCFDLVHSCPHLSFLALRGFKLHDQKARILVKGFRKLKLVDFSTSYPITGSFLRNLGGCASVLEVLVLRDCLHLKEVEVTRFLLALLAGDFKLLKTLDISNKDGLAAEEDWYRRCYNISNLPIAQVMKERPDMCLVADFPTDERFADVDQMADSDVNSEISVPSQVISLTSDSSLLSSSDSSSYTSDPGSGNDDTPEIAIAAFVDNPDDMDFMAW